MAYGANLRLPSDSKTIVKSWDKCEENIDIVYQQRYEAVQKLQQELSELIKNVNDRALEQGKRTNELYNEQGLKVGDVVLQRFEGQPTKLHPKRDGPFIISDSKGKGVFVLRTANGHVLRMSVNGSFLTLFSGDAYKFYYASQALHRRDNVARKREISTRRVGLLPGLHQR